jgi:hypothetical protein
MNIDSVREMLGDQAVFRTGNLLAGQQKPAHVRRQLARWVKAGKVIALRRGVYMLAEPYARQVPHPFVLANEMRRASYVSMQSALAWFGCIPEYVPTVTSVTTERPEEIDNPAGRFIFRHIKHDLLWGMTRVDVAPSQVALVARPEKALIDLLYLTPRSDHKDYLDELRLDLGEHLSPDRLLEMAVRTGSHKVLRAVRYVVRVWEQEEQGETV